MQSSSAPLQVDVHSNDVTVCSGQSGVAHSVPYQHGLIVCVFLTSLVLQHFQVCLSVCVCVCVSVRRVCVQTLVGGLQNLPSLPLCPPTLNLTHTRTQARTLVAQGPLLLLLGNTASLVPTRPPVLAELGLRQ